MKEPIRAKIDLASVLRATARNQASMWAWEKAVNDPASSERKEAGQCRACFYVYGRQGGSVCTQAECAMCGKVMGFGNTCLDVLCLECAKANRLCRHCGADAENKNRRKL